MTRKKGDKEHASREDCVDKTILGLVNNNKEIDLSW